MLAKENADEWLEGHRGNDGGHGTVPRGGMSIILRGAPTARCPASKDGRTDYADFDFYDCRGAHLVVAVADGVPAFDISRSCKLDTAATTGLAVDQSLKNCVDDENRARQQLDSQWSKFSASSKAECIPLEGIGGDPSYVSLLTCLQMYLWDRQAPAK